MELRSKKNPVTLNPFDRKSWTPRKNNGCTAV